MVWRVRVAVCLALLVLAAPVRALSPEPAASFQVRPASEHQRSQLNARVFDAVVNTVEAAYYDPTFNGVDWAAHSQRLRPRAVAATSERDLYLVLAGLLEPLEDQHANVQGPSVWAMMARAQAPRVSGGMTLRQVGRREQVVSVRIDGPADRAGVRPGWFVDRIDGAPFSWRPLLDAEPGQVMRWTLSDEDGGVHEAVLTLAPPVPSAPPRRVDQPAPGVYRLAWDTFDDGVAAWVGRTLESVPDGAAVILDLRGNIGGSMRETRTILGCFLPVGTPLFEITPRDEAPGVLDVLRGCRPFPGKVVALVDRGSTSAAELLPMALVEAGRAVAVGEPTAGSVLLSFSTELPDGGRLAVSRADLRTVAGTRMEKIGLRPAVEAVTTLEDTRHGRDPALEAAIARLSAPRD